MKGFLLTLTVLAGCASPPAPSKAWPATAPSYFTPLLTDGTVHPEWIGEVPQDTPRLVLPDTLPLPRQRLGAVVASGDTLRANVVADVAGYELCPPCEPGLQCEPCWPDRIVLRAWIEPYAAQTLAWFEMPPASYETLRAFQRVVASVEVRREGDGVTYHLLGMTDVPGAATP
ncbi:hypothetical protein [Rubricoccus marinus]|uniref:Lipoprotein n=1 Tax=Rubricoccus marinus TaxID=716817 RepID=A0A259TXL1_9BACT|nr:hypothetical protein [Rubricoccus marinus]OZC02492.1 hypothetical protein BSZ36_05565 [Rubricoccus marinus]